MRRRVVGSGSGGRFGAPRSRTRALFLLLVGLFIGYCIVLLLWWPQPSPAPSTAQQSPTPVQRKLPVAPIDSPSAVRPPSPLRPLPPASQNEQQEPIRIVVDKQATPILQSLIKSDGFRSSDDRPERKGLEKRSANRDDESKALQEMWSRLDKETKVLNKHLGSVSAKKDPIKSMEESMKQFEQRMSDLKAANESVKALAQQASQLLTHELYQTQNPSTCAGAKYLFVENDKNNFGFGAQLHHFVYTLIVGYASNRVVVIEKEKFKYTEKMGDYCGHDKRDIECIFHPLGNCSRYISDSEGLEAPIWLPGDEDSTEPILRLRQRSSVEYRGWIPKKLKEVVEQFHERPVLWFVGHFTAYFMRPSAKAELDFIRIRNELNFTKPIMGMHVRGKEKKSEAPVHNLVEYMPYVRYPTIYMATDDEDPIKDTKDYQNYKWIMMKDSASGRVSGVGDRHAPNAILNLINDMYLLSECDFFIGTDSSQVSRAVYEIMQTKHLDASRLGVSLDTIQKDHEFSFYWFLI